MKNTALYLLLPVVLIAQQGPPRGSVRQREQSQPAPTKPEDLSAMEGQVVNAVTGEPLGKAALTLRRADSPPGPPGMGGPARSYSASSDASGKFSITNIEPGKYRLSATRTGFVAAEFGARDYMQTGTTFTLDPKQNMRDLMFRMTPNGVITGKVVDEDREPVAFLQVQAMRHRYSQGKKQLVSYGSATTNDIGEYRIFGLPPGRYYISVSARRNYGPDRRPTGQQGPEEEYVASYYPATTEAAAAAPIDIVPGALFTGANVALGKRRTVHVKGRVSDASSTGNERRRPMVFLIPRALSSSSLMMRPSSIDASGNFDIRGITAGSYTLVALMQDRGKSIMTRVPVEVGNSNVENLSITINPALSLSGTVRLDGEGVASVSTVQVNLRPRDPIGMIPGSSNPTSKVNTDGSFTLSNVNADHYNVTLSGLPDGFYVKSVSLGGQDALLAGLNLSSGAAGTIDILLAPNAGQAVGVVQNEQQQPAPGVTVVLIPQEKERKEQTQYYKTATTDAAGGFTFKNLDPGQYKVYAWKEMESGAYMDPEFVAPVENRGATLTIREGSQESLQVKLIG
jgi:Carboxypeptidase regulatory-like domain